MGETSVVLTAIEFCVAWAAEGHQPGHPVLPAPGAEHACAELVEQAWGSLADRGLAQRGRIDAELADRLAVLAGYRQAVDTWIWAEQRIGALAAAREGAAQLAVVDGEEVWLIPARASALAESAVSVCDRMPAGAGRPVSVPEPALIAAEQLGEGRADAMVTGLARAGVAFADAQALAGMYQDVRLRGRFGAERRDADGRVRRADRVVAFHDNPTGRFAYRSETGRDGTMWASIAPADNEALAMCVRELLDEL